MNKNLLFALPSAIAVLSGCAAGTDAGELDSARLELAHATDYAGSCDPDDCGQYVATNSCQCDDACAEYGDCCADVDAVCNAPGLAGEGEMCGGFAGVQCEPGLTCDYPTGSSAGTCVLESDDECSTNDDCDDGFCGWADNNVTRICKPWGQVGDSCEGFTLPAFRNFCGPDLFCDRSGTNDPTGDKPGVCAAIQYCLSNDACDAGESCDMSVCLSNCPEGKYCPAVCWGQCVPGETVAQEGEACSMYGTQCADGLDCEYECVAFNADGSCANTGINPSGTCVAPVDPALSCTNRCGDFEAGMACQCDSQCAAYGDCCEDLTAVCG